MAITLRTYRPADKERVRQPNIDTLAGVDVYYESSGPEFDPDMDRLEEVYLADGSTFWLLEDGDRLVGMTAVRRIDEQTAEIKRMRVAIELRRQGLGQRLLSAAESFCREQRYRRIVLDTSDEQVAAIALYEKNDYRMVDRRTIRGVTVLYLAKDL